MRAITLLLVSSFVLPLAAYNLKKSELRNPSWEELQQFLSEDPTHTKEYQAGKFDCKGFAIELRDDARDNELRCGYVSIQFDGKPIGHALNVFETDQGEQVFVDAGGENCIAYVEKGKPYGMIAASVVRQDQFIDCNQLDIDGLESMEISNYVGSIFSYDYYEAHETCRLAYDQSLSQYNFAVNNYNNRQQTYYELREQQRLELERYRQQRQQQAKQIQQWSKNLVLTDAQAVERYNNYVVKFNEEGERFNRQIEQFNAETSESMALANEKNRLNQWLQNLNQLKNTLGPQRSISGIVSQIQVYW